MVPTVLHMGGNAAEENPLLWRHDVTSLFPARTATALAILHV